MALIEQIEAWVVRIGIEQELLVTQNEMKELNMEITQHDAPDYPNLIKTLEGCKSTIEKLQTDKAELVGGLERSVKRLENVSGFYTGSPSNKRDHELIAKHKDKQ